MVGRCYGRRRRIYRLAAPVFTVPIAATEIDRYKRIVVYSRYRRQRFFNIGSRLLFSAEIL